MFQYGVGGLWGNPVGGNQASPTGPQKFGTIQDVSVDFDQQLVELRGQSKFPDDVAPGNMTIKGKAGFGRIEIDVYNALYFAQTITTGVDIIANSEAQTVPASSTYTITVTNAATFTTDLGVSYTSNGQRFILVNSVSAAGQYSVNSSSGVYTFDSADASVAVQISYAYTNTGGRTLPVNNQLMGYGPVFEMWLSMPYDTTGPNALRLYQCRCSKMNAPLKRDGYMIPDFEFMAYANSAGNVFSWYELSPE